ncbi:MAG: type II toxin-antitoxin system VapC family toxin [Solirubrobacterales bacterium]|nr:type II toxin-antitoxin system VapC family toxin [Solirubrobacterales bacterium]
MSGLLADTSIFIAREQGRSLPEAPPGPVRVSVMTLTELRIGVLRAADAQTRHWRTRTLDEARTLVPLTYDERVGERLAEIIAAAREQRRRAGLADAVVAATALAYDLTVWTQDDDFEVLADLEPALRVHRN